jgi:hypothetical protein
VSLGSDRLGFTQAVARLDVAHAFDRVVWRAPSAAPQVRLVAGARASRVRPAAAAINGSITHPAAGGRHRQLREEPFDQRAHNRLARASAAATSTPTCICQCRRADGQLAASYPRVACSTVPPYCITRSSAVTGTIPSGRRPHWGRSCARSASGCPPARRRRLALPDRPGPAGAAAARRSRAGLRRCR